MSALAFLRAALIVLCVLWVVIFVAALYAMRRQQEAHARFDAALRALRNESQR